MADENPYAPPEADVTVSESSSLASLGLRLGGAIIDTIIALAVLFPLMYLTGYWESAMAGEQTVADTVLWAITGVVAFLVVHGYLLANYGQTVGKRLVGTRIVSVQDDKILPFGRVIGLRYLPLWVVSQVPAIGPLLGIIDVLFIFRRDRRCVHDLIAGTKVVMA